MHAKTLLTTLILVLASLPALGGDSLAGRNYRADVIAYGESEFVQTCMTFHSSGRLTMAHSDLTIAWTQPYDRPDLYAAVTRGGDRTITPYQFAVHGIVISGKTVLGSTINERGQTSLFIAEPDDDCKASPNVRKPASECVVDALAGRKVLSDCALAPYLDPASQVYSPSVATCQVHWCDPAIDPLRQIEERLAVSVLKDRSFRISAAGPSGSARAMCWTFGDDGIVRTDVGPDMAWTPDYLWETTSTFQAVARSWPGEGAAFSGALVGDELLEVHGILAFADGTASLYGFGQEVKSCKNR